MITGSTEKLKRLTVNAKDVSILTGRSEQYGRRALATIRKKKGKLKHQFVLLTELCDYLGIPTEEAARHLNLSRITVNI